MKILIDKTICKYLFLHNLSGWHYSAIPPFKHYWSRHPQALTLAEKKAINDWRDREQQHFNKTNLFLIEDHFKDKLTRAQNTAIKYCFEALSERFDCHFKIQIKKYRKNSAVATKNIYCHSTP